MRKNLSIYIDHIILNNLNNKKIGSLYFSLLSKNQKRNFLANCYGFKDYENMEKEYKKTFFLKKRFPYFFPDHSRFDTLQFKNFIQKNYNSCHSHYILEIFRNIHSQSEEYDDYKNMNDKELSSLLSLNYNEIQDAMATPKLSEADATNFIYNKKSFINKKEHLFLQTIQDISNIEIQDPKDLLGSGNVFADFKNSLSIIESVEKSLLHNNNFTIKTIDDIKNFHSYQKELTTDFFLNVLDDDFFLKYFRDECEQKENFRYRELQNEYVKFDIIDFREIDYPLEDYIPFINFVMISQTRGMGYAYLFLFRPEHYKTVTKQHSSQSMNTFVSYLIL